MGLLSRLGVQKPRIFVQIASFRDPECQWTVKDLYEKAAHPERVFVGICWQYDKLEDKACFTVPYPYPKQVRVKEYDHNQSKGSGWARSEAQSLVQDEEYTLQIDSHMRFEPGWDETLIDMHKRCPTQPALISTSLPGYKPGGYFQDVKGMITYVHIAKLGDNNDPQLVHAHGGTKDLTSDVKRPFPTPYVINNFVFGESAVWKRVPIDPHIYFFCDELCWSARLFTHGIDIYQPDKLVVRHQWDRTATSRSQNYYGLKNPHNVRSRARALHLLEIAQSKDPEVLAEITAYDLGDKRLIADYWPWAGWDLSTRTLTKKAYDGNWEPAPPVRTRPAKLPTIFVQIACYRDPECQWTVKDLFDQALYPERISVGICWQYDKEADADCFEVPSPRPKQTRIMHVKASDSKGICWARHEAQKLYKDEDYLLQIDSHMRFIKGWDQVLIDELNACPSTKPIISSYPPGYRPPRELNAFARLSVMATRQFNKDGGVRGEGISLESWPDRPLRGAFIAGGFVFAKASLIVEVPYDPYMYFDQDEITLSVRFFTHGWDVYHPTRNTIYHYYKKAGDPNNRKLLHWENNKDWRTVHDRAHKRFHHLVQHTLSTDPEVIKEMDHYGLGTKRTVEQFTELTGMDFKTLFVTDYGIKGEFVPDIEKWKRAPVSPAPVPKLTPSTPAVAAPKATLAPTIATAVPDPAARFLTPKTPLQKLAPLEIGQILPPFMLPDDVSGTDYEIHLYGGKRLVLFFLPLDWPDYLDSFFRYHALRKEDILKADCRQVFIIQGSAQEAKALREKYKIDQHMLHDPTGALFHAFDLKPTRVTPLSVMVNAAQKIIGMFDDRNAENQLADALRAMAAQEPIKPYIATQLHPPVLLVPDVMPVDLRGELIEFWRKGRQYAGTIGLGGDAKVVAGGKRRTDVDISDRGLLKRLDDQIAKTILPELRKVSAFEAMFRETYKVGRYGNEDAGYYHQHRDTGVKSLAYRRYSMSLALTDDYDGGLLHFPEYGSVHYKLPAGSAALFPSALLHGVTPVTRGERYVMVSFFHGPLEEAYRKRQILAAGKPYDESLVQMMVEPRYTDLPQSQYFYTSSIITRVIDE